MAKIIILLIISLLALSACSAKNYEVTTKSGDKFTLSGALEYDVQSESYLFKNNQGETVTLSKSEIQITQQK